MARPETPLDPTTNRPLAFDHLPKKQGRRQPVDVVFDQDAVETYNELMDRLSLAKTQLDIAARGTDETRVANLRDEVESLTAEAEAEAARLMAEGAVVRFMFRSIGARAYDDLINDHPPTAEQIEAARSKGDPRPHWNEDTFAKALIAASCESPEMTVDQVSELFKSPDWNDAELSQLIGTAMLVNLRATNVDLGKGSGKIPRTERNSDTA